MRTRAARRGSIWQITSYGMWIETQEAYGCARWPLKGRQDAMLSVTEAAHAGCKLRPRTRPLHLVAHLEDGSRVVVEDALPAAPQGRQVWFGDVLAKVALGADVSDLRTLRRLEFGEGAWLVELDVQALFRGLTDRVAAWSTRGWATPYLFGTLVKEHPFEYVATMFTLEQMMVRQERDYVEVLEGKISGQTFLLRHDWSPYQIAVRRHLGAWSDAAAGARAPRPSKPREPSSHGGSSPREGRSP
ncbi:MAG: hypothetical protein ACPHRO_02350 [Nannocystaceae bacterium]